MNLDKFTERSRGFVQAAQTIAMRDLDQRYAGCIQGARHVDHFLDRDLMALGMHAVAQTHVVQFDCLTG